ncbi:acyltransferase [Micromonospora olivasterospora]|uniref:Peptidoglycan/LPS O-acetylase OafA/YrhL n=1 Tax=Micromonospora olivasterospora TaxID=1880 RepID=A0A562ID77_MICOL|nr:peptidoglycan/LPS O-acetylase OafA/YrhL [Micromonospora olivasterospora]
MHAGGIAGPDAMVKQELPRQGHGQRPSEITPSRRDVQGQQRRGRLYVLDLLRFFAAISVLGFHVFVDNDNRGAWGAGVEEIFGGALVTVFRYGWMGVEFFFVISGFVICMSCWGRSVTDFAVSRVTRLMPAYVFAVLVTSAALTLWPLETGRPQPSHVLINATMLQTFVGITNIDSVYWTLFIELKFYLLFAIVVWFGLTYRRVVLFCALWMVAALYAEHSQLRPLIQFVESGFAPYFVAGIALYLIHRFGPNLVLWGILGTSMVIGLITLGRRVAGQNAERPVISFEVALPIMFLFYGLMIAVALGWFSWVKWRGLTVIGALTYPVYLMHMQLSRIAVDRLHDTVSPWVLLAGVVTGVLLLAYLTHRFVEKPVARVLRQKLREGFAQIRGGSDDNEHRNDRRMAKIDQRSAPARSPRTDAESVA